MKIFLLIIVLSCCVLIGFLFKKYLFLRKQVYKDINNFIEIVENNISFNNEKMENIVKKNISLSFFGNFLKEYNSFLTNEISKEDFIINARQKIYFLSTSEQDEILSFFLNIGKRSKDDESQFLKNHLIFFKQKLQEAELKNNKFGVTSLKLFIVLGLLLFIIFL